MNKEKREMLEEIKRYFAPYSEVKKWLIDELEQTWNELEATNKELEEKSVALSYAEDFLLDEGRRLYEDIERYEGKRGMDHD